MQNLVKVLRHACVRICRATLVAMVAAIFLATVHPASAQSTYGNFVGTVSDSSGAVVPNATIEVKENSTGVSRTSTTDERGDFSLINMDAGIYSATVTATGFSPREFKDVHLLARETVRLDSALQAGGGDTSSDRKRHQR